MSRAIAERIVALSFVALCVAYGFASQNIQLLFGAEFSPFNARTFPTLLAWAGGLVALLIAAFPGNADNKEAFEGLAWTPALLLTGTVILYGLAIPFVGFFAASTVFLALGCAVLGERRVGVVLAVAVGISLGLWIILDLGLGIFLDDPLLRAVGLQ